MAVASRARAQWPGDSWQLWLSRTSPRPRPGPARPGQVRRLPARSSTSAPIGDDVYGDGGGCLATVLVHARPSSASTSTRSVWFAHGCTRISSVLSFSLARFLPSSTAASIVRSIPRRMTDSEIEMHYTPPTSDTILTKPFPIRGNVFWVFSVIPIISFSLCLSSLFVLPRDRTRATNVMFVVAFRRKFKVFDLTVNVPGVFCLTQLYAPPPILFASSKQEARVWPLRASY